MEDQRGHMYVVDTHCFRDAFFWEKKGRRYCTEKSDFLQAGIYGRYINCMEYIDFFKCQYFSVS